MEDKEKQCIQILNFIKEHESITDVQAFVELHTELRKSYGFRW